MENNHLKLDVKQLRHAFDPKQFSFQSTAELAPLHRIIGQPRAIRALDFGVNMPNHGYNIYVVGPPGSGRTTLVRQILGRMAEQRPAAAEWCYVYNFQDARRPHALSLPTGRATQLRDMMNELVQQLQIELPKTFEGEFYEQRRREIGLELQRKQQELLHSLEEYLNERGFALIRSQLGLTIAPMRDGKVMSGEEYEQLDPDVKKAYESHRAELMEQFDKTMRQARDLDREGKRAMDNVTSDLSGFVVSHLMQDLRERFADCPKVQEYLQAVRDDVVQNADKLIAPAQEENSPLAALSAASRERWPDRYKVNLLGDGHIGPGAPVVIEDNPTYHNLIGRIEHRAEFGAMVTDFAQIRSGALHRANGGYLVMEAKRLLANPLAWEGLKRALSNRQIKIEDMSQFYGLVATVSLEPEPVPLDVKVVLIGDEYLFQLLYAYDEDFRELFKVKAEFATQMDLTQETSQDYALFIGDLCRAENLKHFDPEAVAGIIDQAARSVSDQHKLTTRFAEVADLVREASFWASRAGREVVTAQDVSAAVGERRYRMNYIAERYRERILEQVLLIDVEGAAVGQVNGLSVMQLANFEFGIPSRITAKTFMGKSGVISIDREVKLSGPIHDKGQLILASYLASHLAQKRTMSMSATLTFEQNYGGVEGDSASSTELYAILSSLADAPIKQGLAVTGSVNQLGQVQAIGGVNAKIEGFFDVCQAKGLTGDQGVLIPQSNVRHLMLREDVVQAVSEGKFAIYAVSAIKEGIELLTGIRAGEPDAEGNYPADTIFGRVQAKLEQYARNLQEEGKEDKEESESESAKGEDTPQTEEE